MLYLYFISILFQYFQSFLFLMIYFYFLFFQILIHHKMVDIQIKGGRSHKHFIHHNINYRTHAQYASRIPNPRSRTWKSNRQPRTDDDRSNLYRLVHFRICIKIHHESEQVGICQRSTEYNRCVSHSAILRVTIFT